MRRSLSAISEAHKRNGYVTPCNEWVVKNTLRRLRREYGIPANGKNPLLVDDLRAMLKHCPPTLEGLEIARYYLLALLERLGGVNLLESI